PSQPACPRGDPRRFSWIGLPMHRTLEADACRLPTADDCPDGDAENLGCLGLAQVVIPQESENLSLVLGQSINVMVKFGPLGKVRGFITCLVSCLWKFAILLMGVA